MTSREEGLVRRHGNGELLPADVRVMETARSQWRFERHRFELAGHLVASHLRAFRPLPLHSSVLEPDLYLRHANIAPFTSLQILHLYISLSLLAVCVARQQWIILGLMTFEFDGTRRKGKTEEDLVGLCQE